MVDIHQPIDNRKSTYAPHPNHECRHQRRRAAVLGTTNVRGVRYDMLPQHTNYLRYLKRGEDKMTWGEKVGKNKRAIIKYGIKDNLTLAG